MAGIDIKKFGATLAAEFDRVERAESLEAEVERLRAVNAQLLAVMRTILLNVRDPDRLTHSQAAFKLKVIELEASKAIKAAEAGA